MLKENSNDVTLRTDDENNGSVVNNKWDNYEY